MVDATLSANWDDTEGADSDHVVLGNQRRDEWEQAPQNTRQRRGKSDVGIDSKYREPGCCGPR